MLFYIIISIVLILLLGGGLLWRRKKRKQHRIEAPTLIPEPGQHAIVLAHGVLGFDHLNVLGTKHHYFRGIADHLQQHGAVIHATKVAPLGTVPERAEILADYIAQLDEKRVIIIAHSMGGLDSRYALSNLGLAKQVKALVTIATPHHGSYLAHAAEKLPGRALLGLLGKVGVQTDAVRWLGEAPSKPFNQENLDADNVFYGSVIGETNRKGVLGNPLLMACYEILLRNRGANDGMVPTSSQRWGKELSVIPANHFAQIGWSPRFNANTFYLQLLQILCEHGFSCLPSAALAEHAQECQTATAG